VLVPVLGSVLASVLQQGNHSSPSEEAETPAAACAVQKADLLAVVDAASADHQLDTPPKSFHPVKSSTSVESKLAY